MKQYENYFMMAKFAGILFLTIQCTSIIAQQHSGMPKDFLLKFMESFKMDNIMIIRNSTGIIYLYHFVTPWLTSSQLLLSSLGILHRHIAVKSKSIASESLTIHTRAKWKILEMSSAARLSLLVFVPLTCLNTGAFGQVLFY